MDEFFNKMQYPYLSKTAFTNGPQNLKMVKVDCKGKRRKDTNQVCGLCAASEASVPMRRPADAPGSWFTRVTSAVASPAPALKRNALLSTTSPHAYSIVHKRHAWGPREAHVGYTDFRTLLHAGLFPGKLFHCSLLSIYLAMSHPGHSHL